MITVAGQKRLLSDLVASIKADPLTPWHKGYDFVMGEKDLDSVHLARYRGNGPTLKSAMSLAPLARAKVNANDVVAINALMTTGGVGNGISDKSAHTPDPEAGFPKSGSVTVPEFYVSGYSKSHVANTYEHARLV